MWGWRTVAIPAIVAVTAPAQSEFTERAAARNLAAVPLTPAMVAAAERGLAWLAREQLASGAWVGHVGHKRGDGYLVSTFAADQRVRGAGHVGVTALAAMAFLAGGHLPGRGPYGHVVERALDHVLSCARENGYITESGTRMYGHAFATLFLAQVHGMASDPRLESALERATQWIVDCQNAQGGWRYNPFTTEADLSVTVCQLQALRAARNIGIHVPRSTIDRAIAYVMRARTPAGPARGLFYYKTKGRRARIKNRRYAINAAALTSLLSAGVHDHEVFAPVLGFLDREYAFVSSHYGSHYYFWYGNYYASQAWFHAGDTWFVPFHRRIVADLLARQEEDGRWRNDVGPGDVLATAVACLILQIPYQYLPIFQR